MQRHQILATQHFAGHGADQHAQRILLPGDRELRRGNRLLRAVVFRFGLALVEACAVSRVGAARRHAQGFFTRVQGLAQQFESRIEHPQSDVTADRGRGDGEAHRIARFGGGQQVRLRRCARRAQAPEQIHFVSRRHLRLSAGLVQGAAERTDRLLVRAGQQAGHVRPRLRGDESVLRTRFLHARSGDREIDVAGECLFDERIERGIVELPPPVRIDGFASLRLRRMPGRGRFDRRIRRRLRSRARAGARKARGQQRGADARHRLVSTCTTTDMPGRRRARRACPGSMATRMPMRCGTFTKLPVALSGLSTENSEPAAGDMRSRWPSNSWSPRASTVKRTGWPGRIRAVCASLKFAMIQRSFGTSETSCVPLVTYWPRRTPTSPICPLSGAWMIVLPRSISASRNCACAAATCASRPARPTSTVRKSCRAISLLERACSSCASAWCNAATVWSRSRMEIEPSPTRSSARAMSARARNSWACAFARPATWPSTPALRDAWACTLLASAERCAARLARAWSTRAR